ncbi:MAG: ExbD/TolR family protein [Hydromonas sp.]|nr:ExbD/TolR family protein [Hydromonas sp.]
MKSIVRRRARRTHAQMNVVPYIDVMLVLLVIFMVVTPMMQTKVMDLPSVSSANTPQEPPLVIQMDTQGRLSLSDGSTFTSTSDLVSSLTQRIQQKPQAVVLAADKAMNYGEVMAVMDALKQARIERVGLLLKQSESKNAP